MKNWLTKYANDGFTEDPQNGGSTTVNKKKAEALKQKLAEEAFQNKNTTSASSTGINRNIPMLSNDQIAYQKLSKAQQEDLLNKQKQAALVKEANSKRATYSADKRTDDQKKAASQRMQYIENPGLMDYVNQAGYIPLLAMSNPFEIGENLKKLRTSDSDPNLSSMQKFDASGAIGTEATGNALINAATDGLVEGIAPAIISKGKELLSNTYKLNPLANKLGNYMTNFPASEAKIFEGQPHWLKGYKEVPKTLKEGKSNFKSEIVTPEGFQNRLFKSNIQLEGPNTIKPHISEKGYNYRVLSEKEIKSIKETKGVFPREGKQKGGNKNVKYWTEGNEKNWYGDSPDLETIRVKSENFHPDKIVRSKDVEVFDKVSNQWKSLESRTKFESEINWGKWNKEIPDNKGLMDEYHAIEQTSKADGSWMKNPDGSAFQGTPEQFVQQNSSNFKKAFPEGSENVFRGTGENIAELRPNRSTFTANQELASGYAPFNKKSNFLNSESVEGGVHSFYRKNSKNSLELDANNTSWTSVDLSNRRLTKDYFERNIKSQEDQITKQKEYLSKMKQNPNGSWEAPDGTTYSNDLYKNTVAERELYLKDLKERYKNIDNLISNPKELEEMKKVLGNTTTTDDIAAYVEKRNLDYVKLKNIEDSGVGDVTIINHKPGNYLKSAIGNNGMFDMTNPNIYKALVPAVAGTTAYGLQEKKNGGWLTKYK